MQSDPSGGQPPFNCRASSDIGPWVKGRNFILLNAFELDPFKSALSGVTPENMTGGANPRIDSVLEETTGEYDELRRDIQVSPDGKELSFLNYVNSSSHPDGDWWGQDVLLTITIGGIPTTRWLTFKNWY